MVYSHRVIVNECEPGLYAAMVAWIRDRGLAVRSIIEPCGSEYVPTLSTQARFFSFVFLRRRKYSATRLTKARSMGASLVRVRIPEVDGSTWTWCGVIEDLVEVVYGEQNSFGPHEVARSLGWGTAR